MQKRILIPNGNYTDIPLIKAYKDMGLYVITSGNDPSLIGHKYADEYVGHDYSDYAGMLEIAKDLNLDYVSSCANDLGVITAAYIAENLNLPGNDSFLSARTVGEKDLFKQFGKKYGLSIIPSEPFSDISLAMDYIKTALYPLIVKPTDLGGGKGVTKADTIQEAEKAVQYAFERSKQHHIVIEPYIESEQFSFSSFVVNKKVATYSSFNEFPSQYNPFLVGYSSCPYRRIRDFEDEMIEQVEKISLLLNLCDGVFHMQCRIFDGHPVIMECMRRCLGNYSFKNSGDSVGFEWEPWVAKAHCGMDCTQIPKNRKNEKHIVEYYIQAPRNGIVEDVKISPLIQSYVYDSMMQWEKGMEIDNYKAQMLGFIFMDFTEVKAGVEIEDNMDKYVQVIMK